MVPDCTSWCGSIGRLCGYSDSGGTVANLIWPSGHTPMTLAQARAEARAAGALRRAGVNPIEARKAERKARARAAAEATERSLQAVAESYIARHAPAWSKTHHLQWLNSLRTNVYPRLGARDVATIDRSAILDVLESLWMRVPESADRFRRRTRDHSRLRTGAGPARGAESGTLARPASPPGGAQEAAASCRPRGPALPANARFCDCVASTRGDRRACDGVPYSDRSQDGRGARGAVA